MGYVSQELQAPRQQAAGGIQLSASRYRKWTPPRHSGGYHDARDSGASGCLGSEPCRSRRRHSDPSV